MRSVNESRFLEIKDYVDNYIQSHGCGPSRRELATRFNMGLSTVCKYLQIMRDRGMIEYDDYAHRSFGGNVEEVRKVPIVGAIACGEPITAISNVEDYMSLPASMLGIGEFYLLRAKGDSMIDVGISDGDLVIIRQQPNAEIGQIVVALVDDEATLKRYYPEPEKGRVRLHPENANYSDIYVEDCKIQGVAKIVIKELL